MDFTSPTGTAVLSVLVAVVSAVLGALAVDIYTRIKTDSKKIIDKKKQEHEQELTQAITEVLTTTLNPIQRDVALVKKDVTEIVTEDLPQLKGATRDSLRNQLLAVYRYCERQEYRTLEDTENFEYMFRSYEALGGNSFIVAIHEDFLELPVK